MKPQHEIIFEEAAEIHAKEFADGVDADVLKQIIKPYDNYRVEWKQKRIDLLMTLIKEEEK